MIATLPFLQKRFETFNDAYFGGALPAVPLKLSHAVRSLGACTYKKRRKLFGGLEYYDFCIRISTKYDLPENELEDILLHEMIHYEILVNQRRDTSAHGQLFRARMKEFNDRYGRHITVSHRFTPQEQAQLEAFDQWTEGRFHRAVLWRTTRNDTSDLLARRDYAALLKPRHLALLLQRLGKTLHKYFVNLASLYRWKRFL